VLLSTATSAAAFCRTKSCELGKTDAAGCAKEGNCVSEGNPLHWPSACINYAIQADGSPKLGLDGAAFQQLAADTFAAWQDVSCPGGGSPRLLVQFQGFVSCSQTEAVCGTARDNVSVLMFHDAEWPGEVNEIGLTTPTGGVSSGQLVDADLELNSAQFPFSLTRGDASGYALQDVLAHEMGHFLGLSHSDQSGALMSEGYADLAMSRELLTADDIAAICAVYPPGAPLDCAAPAPPAYDECRLAPGELLTDCKLASVKHDRSDAGCSAGAGRAPSGVAAAPFIMLLGLVGWSRRRRFVQNAISPRFRARG
jgi:MYXO-CTERM domain-containing protein